jgi:2-C-methyl-D-erythritol 4-phosphate cytidylyltransferase
MTVWSIVVAGGSGSRFGGLKQFERLDSRTMLEIAVSTARAASDGTVVVVPAAYVDELTSVYSESIVTAGGMSRSDSVRNGLSYVPVDATVVLVHDGARPMASSELFESVIAAVRNGAHAVVPGVPVVDTIKQVNADGIVTGTPDRASLVAVQTPQGFDAAVLRAAHRSGADATDDAALVEMAGSPVLVIAGEASNRKITTVDDLEWARRSLHHVKGSPR